MRVKLNLSHLGLFLVCAALCMSALVPLALPAALVPAALADGKPGDVPSIGKVDEKTPFCRGIICRRQFLVQNAFVDSRSVFLRSELFATGHEIDAKQKDCFTGIRIVFPTSEQFEGKSYDIDVAHDKMQVGTEHRAKPSVLLYANIGGGWDTYQDESKVVVPYSMSLRFFRKTKGYLPGYLELEIADPRGNPSTKIKGYFWAAAVKS